MKVTASDADDPTYGSSARVVYSVLDGERFFTVDRYTGKNDKDRRRSPTPAIFFFLLIRFSCATFLIAQYHMQSEAQRWYFPDQSKFWVKNIKSINRKPSNFRKF